MGERALGWGLRLLGLALAIGPFIVALGMHDWDIQSAVMPSEEEMGEVRGRLSGLIGGFRDSPFELGALENIGNTLRATVGFTSPLKIPVKIKEFSAHVIDQGVRVAQLQMEGEIEAKPGVPVDITLSGSYPGGPLVNPRMENMSMKFESYGVTVKLQIEVREVAP